METTIFNQNYGVEIELTGITRRQAAQVIADFYGTSVSYIGTYYDTYGATDSKGRTWKAMYDGSIETRRKNARGAIIDASKEYSCEVVTPILQYKGSKTGSYLTIEQSKGSYVPIVIWVVSNEDEKNLDIYEGFPRFYYKKQFRISTSRGPIKAFAYIMTDGRPYGIPTDRYIDTCTEGYRDFGFDADALTKAYTDTVEEMSK